MPDKQSSLKEDVLAKHVPNGAMLMVQNVIGSRHQKSRVGNLSHLDQGIEETFPFVEGRFPPLYVMALLFSVPQTCS